SDEEAANYFARADAVVMPYISATGSGVATLAYHYNKPIIATDTPGLNEAVSAETGWLIKPGSVSELASCISKLSKNELDKKLPASKSYRKTNSWANMSEKIVEFLKDPIQ